MQPFLKKYSKHFIAPAAICLVLIFYFFSREESASTVELIEPIVEAPVEGIIEPPEMPAILPVLVDVKGAVLYPGVYELTEQDRIIDAITMAGGYADGAEPKLINHAQKLQDEMVIYIPRKGEQLEEDIPQLIQVAGTNGGGGTSKDGKINLNQANETELTTLPGIGPAKATAIIGYRTETGRFQTIDDLKNVSGIGDKTFEQLRDLIDVK